MKRLALILLVLLYFINTNYMKAEHLMGAEITWTCVGQDSFLVKFIGYRDCNGITLTIDPITFKCASSSATITTLTMPTASVTDVTPICNSGCNRCKSSSCSFPYGVEKYSSQAIVNLSSAASCCNIIISWQQAPRINTITTGAAGQNFYVESKLNRCLSPCDNSPTFSNPPIAIMCVGQDFTYNNGAYDIDGNSNSGLTDSLTICWAAPLSAANTAIPYTGSYAYNKPIYFWGFPNEALPFPRGLHLDAQTGDIQFRPMKAEVTVMVIQVNEFRNGVKIGEIRRDIQIIVIPCLNNNNPVVVTPNNVRAKTVCAGSQVSFTFSTTDPNTTDTGTLSWSNNLPGATWTTTNGMAKHPTATVVWTPTESQASNLPYTFTVKVKDNACPISAQFTQAYQITVKHGPKANVIVSDSGCGKYFFKALPILGVSPSYYWYSDSFTFSPNSGTLTSHNFVPGSYPFKLGMGAQGCSSILFDTVVVDPFMSVYLPADTPVCVNSTISLQARVVNPKLSYSLKWGSGNVSFPADTNLTKQITVTKDTSIWVRAAYGSINCPNDEIRIRVHPSTKISLPVDTFLCDLNHIITPSFTPNISVFNLFRWYKNSASTAVDSDAILNVFDTGFYSCVATDTFGCTVSDNIKIHKTHAVVASALSKVICWGDEAELKADTTGGGFVRYEWYDGTKLVGNTQSIKTKPTSPTQYALKVKETTAGATCADSTTIWVSVNPLPIIRINPIDKRCVIGSIINLNNFVTVNGTSRPGGIWSSQSAGLIYDDKFNPITAGVSSPPGWKVKFDYTDPVTACNSFDSAFVTIFALPKPYAGPDDSICNGAKIRLTGSPTIPPGSWRGIGVEGSYPNWKFNPDTTGIVNGGQYAAIYHYKDNNQCENEDTVKISVFFNPTADAGNPMEFCENDSVISLTGSPSGGIWSGAGVSGNQFDPLLATPGIHNLKYSVTNVICTVSDIVKYEVFSKPTTPVITISSVDSFLECNLSTGNFKWFYKVNQFSSATLITANVSRINPKLYCNNCYYGLIFADLQGCVSDTSTLFNLGAYNSVDNNGGLAQIKFYPNPAHAELIIENPNPKISNLKIFDIFGKNLFQSKLKKGLNTLNITALKPGIYILRLDDSFVYRLVVE